MTIELALALQELIEAKIAEAIERAFGRDASHEYLRALNAEKAFNEALRTQR